MTEENFRKRLSELRQQRKVSARDMSLSIGQNPNYINRIETGVALPSLSGFFFICDYLNITPSEFFDTNNPQPERMRQLIRQIQNLDIKRFNDVAAIVEDIAR